MIMTNIPLFLLVFMPCQTSMVKSKDSNMYALLTDPQYKFATKSPDGNYNPSALPTVIIPLVAVDES